jgi:uncharacterized protein (TIRG00374 family)
MFFNYKKFIIGLIFSVIFFISIYWIADDFSGILEVAQKANYFLVLIGLFFYFSSLLVRSFRWNYLLKKENEGVNTIKLTPIVIVGYMFNNLLPIRTGEIARCFYLENKLGVKKSFALGTVAVERISDVVSLSLILAFTLILLNNNLLAAEFIKLMPGNYYSLISLVVLLFLFSTILIVAPFIRPRINKIFELFRNHSNIIINRSVRFIEQFFDGYFSINNISSLIKLIVISFLIWSLEITMYFFLAISINLSFETLYLFILTIIFFGTVANLAGIFPSTAGGWGSFDFFGVLILISFGVNTQLSLGFVIFVHFCLWAPVTLLGLLIFLKNWVPLKIIKNSNNK